MSTASFTVTVSQWVVTSVKWTKAPLALITHIVAQNNKESHGSMVFVARLLRLLLLLLARSVSLRQPLVWCCCCSSLLAAMENDFPSLIARGWLGKFACFYIGVRNLSQLIAGIWTIRTKRSHQAVSWGVVWSIVNWDNYLLKLWRCNGISVEQR